MLAVTINNSGNKACVINGNDNLVLYTTSSSSNIESYISVGEMLTIYNSNTNSSSTSKITGTTSSNNNSNSSTIKTISSNSGISGTTLSTGNSSYNKENQESKSCRNNKYKWTKIYRKIWIYNQCP